MQKILIDTDPGIDDAMALFFALRYPDLKVMGLTTVFGNTTVANATGNALRILEAAGRDDIPVSVGSDVPLIQKPTPRLGRVHGQDGLGNVANTFPEPGGSPIEVPAAQFIVDSILANPGEITLVPLGPLTNIALALRLEPRIVGLVKEVVLMGGAAFVPGNTSPVAEANIRNDPHSAQLVFSAGWQVVMVGLDVTLKVPMTPAYLASLEKIGTQETHLISQIVPFYQQAYAANYGLGGTIYCHDSSVIAYLIDPSLFAVERVPIFVETEGRAAGFTMPDRRSQIPESSDILVCVGVEGERLLNLYHETLAR